MKRLDLTGQQYGSLSVLEYIGKKGRDVRWRCRCACGKETVKTTHSLRDGVFSCGCLVTKRNVERLTKHGRATTPEYWAWDRMIRRCHSEKSVDYKDYGARGIQVCDRWRYSFEAFFADMGARPSPQHSIDRKNNFGNYEPGNCRWATGEQQANNRRSNRFVSFQGEVMTLAEAHRVSGTPTSYKVVWARLHLYGWSIDAAIGGGR